MTLYISPYRRMTAMREMMNRMFEDGLAENAVPARELLLAVDVKASDEAYDLTALVPGLNADDVNIEVINNTVALRGEFKSSLEDDSKYLMCELPAGRFSRVITLPTALEPSKAEASIKDGVLRLHVPKAEAHRPKSIKVLAG
jgi:HSP20 family protein